MKFYIFLVLIFSSFNLFAANTVRILNASTLKTITGHTNLSFDLVAEVPSDGGITEANPAKTYAPMDTSTTAITTDYFYLNTNAGPNYNLFGYTANGGSKALFTGYYVSFPLVVTIDTTAKYLYAAVKSGSSYIVVEKGSLINPITNGELTFNVSPQKICEGAVAGTVNCSNFDENTPNSIAEAVRSLNLYFFVSTASLTVGSGDIGAPDTTTYPGGVFFQVNLSNQVQTNIELFVSLTSLRKGDKRVIGNFASSSTLSTPFKGTYAYIHSNATDTCGLAREPGGCQGAFSSQSVSLNQEGEFTLNNLTNGQDVAVSVALIDKYGFSTTLSNSIVETPTEIQELLKKQACFLITAGFGEEHYVIDFFRKYRDQVMAQTWLGKKFIKLYYRSAPHYAMIIYQSEWMRSVIKLAAYALYFLFSYYWLVLIFLGSCLFLDLSKNKISVIK